MSRLIIRNDDVNPSTDFKKLEKIYQVIKEYCPDAEIMSCVNIIGKYNFIEAVHPDIPLSNLPLEYFYDADALWTPPQIDLHTIASHGLLHVKHTKLSPQMQEMSIVTSCNLLHTKLFVAPFTDYDATTIDICKRNGITLEKKEDGWRSLESEKFDPNHKLWFFHSWRFTVDKFKEVFSEKGLVSRR